MKQDRRILKTRTTLSESLLHFLREKPVNKITVKELCVYANINRSTFYQHYDNPVSMLEQLEKELYEDLAGHLAIDGLQDVLDTMLAATRYLASNKERVDMLILASAGRSDQLADLLSRIYEHYVDAWKTRFPQMDDRQIGYLFTFLIEGSQSIITSWIKNGFQESPEYIADLTAALCSRVMKTG